MFKYALILTTLFFGEFTKAQSIPEVKNKELYSPRQSTVFSNFSNVNITSEFGDNSASALVAFNIGAASSISFNFKQPFDSKPKKIDFFNQNGLATGTSGEIAFQHIFWKTDINDELFQKLKLQYAKDHKIEANTPQFRGITVGDFSDEMISNFWSDPKNKFGIPILIGAGYAVAKNEINYVVDSFSISPKNENRTNQNVRFSIGALAKNKSVISLSIIQEIKYESGDPITMNFPLNTTGLSYSKDLTIGTPVEKNLTRLQLDYRQSFYKNGVIVFAIAPSIAYRTKQKSLLIDLPIYFLNFKGDDKQVKGLQGGISLGYTNKLKEKTTFKDGFAFSIFVGVPFDLFGFFKTK